MTSWGQKYQLKRFLFMSSDNKKRKKTEKEKKTWKKIKTAIKVTLVKLRYQI